MTTIKVTRQEINDAFQDGKDYSNGGFQARGSLRGLEPGIYSAAVAVINKTGETHILHFSQTIEIS
jgi:hypothetical protein